MAETMIPKLHARQSAAVTAGAGAAFIEIADVSLHYGASKAL